MNWSWKTAKTAFCILTLGAVFLSGQASAQAQTSPSTASQQVKEDNPDQGWHADLTPYLWFSGIHGTVGALGHDASVSASFSDIFSYLNIGVMAAGEVRYNRVIMPTDFMWMKLSDDRALPLNDLTADTAKAKMTETLFTQKIGYRFVDHRKVKVDALFGIRYWHLGSTVTLQGSEIPTTSFSDSASWVDAVAGGKIALALTPKAFVTVLGDAGGGSARHDYQIGGFLGYQISRKCALQLGYRYLSVNYRPNGNAQFVYDVNMPGVVMGVTIGLK